MQVRHKCLCYFKQEKRIPPAGQRQLKVYKRFIPRAHYQHLILPEIRLCGKWLAEIGFDYGKHVLVQHDRNRIVITVDEGWLEKDHR